MTQEEKQLLLIDLCMRLPYKVIGHATWTYMETNGEVKQAEKDRPIEVNDLYAILDFKPYLRPLDSMTEEEIKEHDKQICKDDEYLRETFESPYACTVGLYELEWLNTHHFDYRDLIGKGLALVAPKDMYI